jgi:hypothetical protein
MGGPDSWVAPIPESGQPLIEPPTTGQFMGGSYLALIGYG